MKKLLGLLLLPLGAWAQNSPQQFTLAGTLQLQAPVEWVYLSYASGDQRISDSAQVKDNRFQFSGPLSEPVVGTLGIKKDGRFLSAHTAFLFLEPAMLQFDAKDSLPNFSLKGSKGQKDLNALRAAQKSFESKMSPLMDTYRKASASGDKAGAEKVVAQLNQMDEEMRATVFADFVRKNPSSPVALYALKQYAGWDIDPNRVEPLFLALPAVTRSWPSALAFQEQLNLAKKTAVGAYAMDFTQNDTLGKPVSLSSFKGRYVLIDFWASWCGPCRKENPNVVKAFHQYKDRNFTVLGVSLDRPNAKEKWLKAIHDDGLAWTQVSDLKFWDNEVAKQYGIRAIPQNLLVDAEGKIVAKNIRGEELIQKLELLLPKANNKAGAPAN